MSTTIRLVPLKTNAWAGRTKYPNCFDDIAPFFEESGSIYTGLGDKERKQLKEFPEFNSVDLLPTSPFWTKYKVRVPGEGIVLNKSIANQLLDYYFLRNHPAVKEGLSTLKAGATFALVDETEEARRYNTLAETKIECFSQFKKMTPQQKRDALRLYNESGDSMNDEVVYERLFKNIESNPQKFADKWMNNPHKDTEILISRAMGMGIIKRFSGTYYLGEKETGLAIGRDLGEVIEHLENIKNQEDKMAIMRQLKKDK